MTAPSSSRREAIASLSKRKRRRIARCCVEMLEARTLLSYTFSLTGSTATATGDASGDSLVVTEVGGLLEHSVDGSTPSDDWDDATAGSQTLAADAASIVQIFSYQGPGTTSVTLGTPASPASLLLAQFTLKNDAADAETSTLTVDDSGSSSQTSYTIDSANPSESITATGIRVFDPAILSGITLLGGSGGDTFTVASTFTDEPVAIVGGSGGDTFRIQGTAQPTSPQSVALSVDPGLGSNAIVVGLNGLLANVDGPVKIAAAGGGSSSLAIDDSADTFATNATIGAGAVTGLAPAPVRFDASVTSLVVDSSGGADTLTVDFGDGTAGSNPIANSGLMLNAGSGANTLDLIGGAFTDEAYRPTAPGAGNLSLDGTTIQFSGLSPINDIASAANFTFTEAADAVDIVNGPVFAGVQTTTIRSAAVPPDFERINFGNKANVTVAATGIAPNGVTLSLNNPTPAAGLANLTIAAGAADDFLSIAANPAGVATAVATLSGNDTVSVTAAGVAAAGASLALDGGPGFDTLDVDGSNASLSVTQPVGNTPGTVTNGNGGAFRFIHFESFNISNSSVGTVTSTPVTAQEGLPFTGQYAQFTSGNPDASATDFTATINYGDGTSGPGTITEDAGGVFHVVGSHTYLAAGTNLTTSVAINGGGGSTGSSTGRLTVAAAPITAFPATISAVDGSALSTIVATFSDANPNKPASDYQARIDWGDGSSPTLATAITASGTPNGEIFSVVGSHTYAQVGTLPVTVTITSVEGAQAVAHSTVVIAPAAITATAGAVAALAGSPTGLVTVATFSDAAGAQPLADYTAAIDWGDGGPTSLGQLGVSGGVFTVSGLHTYASPGTYTGRVTIQDGQGASTATTFTTTAAAPSLAIATPAAVAGTPLTPLTIATVAAPSGTPGLLPTNYTAKVDWGDGTTPVSADVVAGTDASGASIVASSGHTYAAPGTDTVTISLYDAQGVRVATASGAITVASPILTPQLVGVTVAGTPLLPLTIATVTVPGTAPAPDATRYTALVDWGDGTTPTPAGVVASASNAIAIVPTSGHIYEALGSRVVTIRLYDAQGVQVASVSTPITVASPVLTALAVPATEGIALVNVPIATIAPVVAGASGLASPIGPYYSVTVDWGDGTGVNLATITPTGVATVQGSHTYAKGGDYQAKVTIGDAANPSLETLLVPITVQTIPLPLAGILNPSSDSGVSNHDAITNVVQPNFEGYTGPGATVTITATPVGGGTPLALGTVSAQAGGFYSLTSGVILPQGSYTVSARAVDANNQVATTAQILPGNGEGNLVIDTAGPKVTNLVFDRLGSRVTVSYQDNLSGLDQATVIDGASYQLTRPRGTTTLTSLAASPASSATGVGTVTLTINGGTHKLPHAFYTFTITAGRILDVAGNALDGEFYGYFPSGNNVPGGNFQAVIEAYHNIALAPVPTNGYASPLSPAGTPAKSLVGSPSKGTAQTATAKKLAAKPATVKAKVVHQASIHDGALSQVASKGRKA